MRRGLIAYEWMQNNNSNICRNKHGLFRQDNYTVIRNVRKANFSENVKIVQKFLVTGYFLRSARVLMHMDGCITIFLTYPLRVSVCFWRISVQLLTVQLLNVKLGMYHKSIFPKSQN